MNFIKTLIAATFALACSFAMAAVDVNKATQAELETIKGVGPAMSGKILEARKTGSFKDWNDMVDRVTGIGNGNAAKFSADGLTVNGATFAAAPAAAAPARAVKASAKDTTPAAPAAVAKK